MYLLFVPAVIHLFSDVIYPLLFGTKNSNSNSEKGDDDDAAAASYSSSLPSPSTNSNAQVIADPSPVSNPKFPVSASSSSSSGLIIGWCTATGTAKRMALLTAADAEDCGITVLSCSCVSEIVLDPSTTTNFFLLLFVATQGDGDAPSTWNIFKSKFQDDLDCYLSCPSTSSSLSSSCKMRCLGFHVVALGDSSYRKFAQAGKDAARWLSSKLFESSSSAVVEAAAAAKAVACPPSLSLSTRCYASPESNTTLCDARRGAAQAEELVESAMNKLLLDVIKTRLASCTNEINALPSSGSSRSSAAAAATTNRPNVYSCAIKNPQTERVPKTSPFPSPSSIQPPSSDRPVELHLQLRSRSHQQHESEAEHSSPSSSSSSSGADTSTILCETRSGAARDVVKVVFDASPLTSRSAVQAGDHLGVYVANSPTLAERCAAALGIPHEKWNWTLVLSSTAKIANRASPKEALPAAVTVIDALRYYPDLSGAPRRRFVSKVVQNVVGAIMVSASATANNGRSELFLMRRLRGRHENSDDGESDEEIIKSEFMARLEQRKKDNGGDVLTSVDVLEVGRELLILSSSSCSSSLPASSSVLVEGVMSLEDFFFLCPRLLPRFFSVSNVFSSSCSTSSLNAQSNSNAIDKVPLLSLLVALLPNGCFSEMIRRAVMVNGDKAEDAHCDGNGKAVANERFFVFLRRTTFHPNLPSHSSFFTPTSSVCHKPIIMIGAGTGVAPFVGFCREIEEFLRGSKHLGPIARGDDGSLVCRDGGGRDGGGRGNGASQHRQEPAANRTSAAPADSSALLPALNVGLFYGYTTVGVGSPYLEHFRSLVVSSRNNRRLDRSDPDDHVDDDECNDDAVEQPGRHANEVVNNNNNNSNNKKSEASQLLRFLTFLEEAESRPQLGLMQPSRSSSSSPSCSSCSAASSSSLLSTSTTAAVATTITNEPQRVQQRVALRAQLLADWIIHKGACIYICGRSAMAREAELAIETEVLARGGGMNADNASKYMQSQLRNTQRLRLDVWES